MAGSRILIAEDSVRTQRMLTTALVREGYQVEVAHNGEEAYQKAIANPPDLVVSDIMMPKMNGWVLIKALRSRPEFAFMPVIFLTALDSDEQRIHGFRLGADDYMTKPVRVDEFAVRVARTIERSRSLERSLRERISAARAASDQDTEGHRPVVVDSQSAIAGDLSQIGLAAILSLLEIEKKTGELTLVRQTTSGRKPAEVVAQGRIFLRGGSVVGARIEGAETLVNADCVYHMLEWDAGHFRFSVADVRMADGVGRSATHLLLEGARRMDEREAERMRKAKQV